MRCARRLTMLLFLAPGHLLLAADPVHVDRAWDFQSDTVGQPPAGFRTAVGKWTIAADGANRVLAQSAISPDSVFNVILQPDVAYADVDVSVRLKANEGTVDQGGGIVWRAKNARTYYVARSNPLEDSFRVYKVIDGKRFQLGSEKTPGDMNWHTLRVLMQGDRITCTLDGAHAIEIDDSSIRGFGRIGLWSKADAQSYFDDLKSSGTGIAFEPPSHPGPTKEFEIRGDRAYLGGQEVDLWGLRAGNAFFNDAVTERFIRNFDNMNTHGINLIGAYIQGVNAGFPDSDIGLNGFTRDGEVLPEVARRIEWMCREADQRGMVVMIGVLSPRKDQDLYDTQALKNAVQNTARLLEQKQLRNVFVDLCHEFDSPLRMDNPALREPDGPAKKDQLQAWFNEIAPDIEAGICPHWKSKTTDSYPTMDVRIIQKAMPIPKTGWVVNVEPVREDYYNNDGIFNATNVEAIFANCRNYLDAPNAAFMFHSGHIQGITNFSGTAPHAEMGGYGTGPTDRGIKFYYEWVRDNVGRWEYPRHMPTAEFSIRPQEG
jgi:hypothetical protein